MAARTSTSIALQEMKRRLIEETARADRTQQFYDAMTQAKLRLEEMTHTLAAERDEARREVNECHDVFDKLNKDAKPWSPFESNRRGSLPGRLALFLASIRA